MTDPCLLRGSLAWAVDDANWDVMGWDGMGWDGMGWDGAGREWKTTDLFDRPFDDLP